MQHATRVQGGPVITRFSRTLGLSLSLLAVTSLGCAYGAYRKAVNRDTPAAYYRFLRDHPRTPFTSERARARLEYHKLKRNPTVEGFVQFRERFPKSPLVAEMRPLFERTAFSVARASGTPAAYASFLERFPEGTLTARAQGNATFLSKGGFAGQPAALASFADQYPDSDFSAEARRSVDNATIRSRSRFNRVGLRIAISPGSAQIDRLTKAFAEAAMQRYKAVGMPLVPISEFTAEEKSEAARSAILTIHHREGASRSQSSGGQLSHPVVVAETRVTLQIGSEGTPIWQRDFSVSVNSRDHRAGSSLLFSAAGREYWKRFFVPVATWQSSSAIRPALDLTRNVVAIDAVGDRSVVLFENGDFRILELADPTAPEILAEYKRREDGRRFNGVALVSGRVVLYGEDGFEVVRFGAAGPEAAGSQARDRAGEIRAVAAVGDELILAGSRGLIVADINGGNAILLMRRSIRGLAAVGDTLIFSDGESLMLSSLELLRSNRLLSELKLGRDFGPARVRLFGDRAVVLGDGGVLLLDMSTPRKPRVLSQLYERLIGSVADAIHVKGRFFLLGDRGLQLLDASGKQVVESVDIQAGEQMSAMGRHMVIAAGQHLQVVDATPFTARWVPSEPRADSFAEAEDSGADEELSAETEDSPADEESPAALPEDDQPAPQEAARSGGARRPKRFRRR